MTPSSQRTLQVLLLVDQPHRIANTVYSHINSIVTGSQHKVWLLPVIGDLPESLDLDKFDVILIHYTLELSNDHFVSQATRKSLAASKAIKGVFIQDEYRHVNDTIKSFLEIGIDLLFTCVPEQEVEKVYPEKTFPNVTKVSVLTGYVDPTLAQLTVPAYEDRKVDVCYRARKVPAWLGECGQEKLRIGVQFSKDAHAYGLKCDISHREEDRIYGSNWIDFLTGCKSSLGVESGASIFDFDGDIAAAVDRDVLSDPSLSYETIKERHFKGLEGKINLNQISPRCFEAASLRTLMILYEGHYSGILIPWRHYVPLKKDHSNMAEVVSLLRDSSQAKKIIDNAYNEIALNPDYYFSSFVCQCDEAMVSTVSIHGDRTLTPYTESEFKRVLWPSFKYMLRRLKALSFVFGYQLVFRYILGLLSLQRRDKVHARIKKIVRLFF